MLPLQFYGQNAHFAISIFAAFVFFAVFWLYFDAWITHDVKANKEIFKWAGFLLLSFAFFIYATTIEPTSFGYSVFGNLTANISSILRLTGYVGIIIGQLIDPLQKAPELKGLADELGLEEPEVSSPPTHEKAKKTANAAALGVATTKSFGMVYILPACALAIGVLYWRRATKGMERHLKPVGVAFILLFGFEFVSLASIWQGTNNPTLFNLVKAFGLLWIMSHVLLLLAVLVLGRWVWIYLIERFMTQLFMVFTAMTLTIFLLTTITFTSLLLHNIQNDSLNNLETAANVLSYALDSKKAETRSSATALAANPIITQAITAKDHKTLANITGSYLQNNKESSLVVTSESAQVLLRAEDPQHWGDSISNDTQVRRALIGTSSSTVASRQDVLAPVVYIKSTVPVRDTRGLIIGTISTAIVADNSFVDGIKHATGLDSAIYSGNVLSATTFTAPDGTSREVGAKESSPDVKNTVLSHGTLFKGEHDVLNRLFLAVYAPLKDADNSVVGMLFIGQPQVSVLVAAGHSIELTFLVAVVLIITSIVPAYLVARYLSRQLD